MCRRPIRSISAIAPCSSDTLASAGHQYVRGLGEPQNQHAAGTLVRLAGPYWAGHTTPSRRGSAEWVIVGQLGLGKKCGGFCMGGRWGVRGQTSLSHAGVQDSPWAGPADGMQRLRPPPTHTTRDQPAAGRPLLARSAAYQAGRPGPAPGPA